MKQVLKEIKNILIILKLTINEFMDNIKWVGLCKKKEKTDYYNILLISHSLEKGLAMPRKKDNFGYSKAIQLKEILNKYSNKNEFAYIEGISVLNAYIEYRKDNKLDYEELIIDCTEKYDFGGAIKVKKEDLDYDFNDFVKLCNIRHSVREYNGNIVSDEDLIKAINIARTAPTACNRQMINVYSPSSLDENKEISKLIPGNTGYKDEITRFIIITADKQAFGCYELDQWYLNGGIFIAYLQLALTANKIGSCMYQWIKNKKNDNKIKEILNIKSNEVIVCVLGTGYYKEEFNVLKAHKRNIEDYNINKKKVIK